MGAIHFDFRPDHLQITQESRSEHGGFEFRAKE
jgi:hypothetical protein